MMLAKGCSSALKGHACSSNCLSYSDGEALVKGCAAHLPLTRPYKEVEGRSGQVLSRRAGWERLLDQNGGGDSDKEGVERFLQREGALLERSFFGKVFQPFVVDHDPTSKVERSLAYTSLGFPDKEVWRTDEALLWRDGRWGSGATINRGELSPFLKGKTEPKVFSRSYPPRHISENPVHRPEERFQRGGEEKKSAEPSSQAFPVDRSPRHSDSRYHFLAEKGESVHGAAERGTLERRGGRVTGESPLLQERSERVAANDGEDWRSLSRALRAGRTFSTIPNHELMKIAELRFSGDMREGDSGEQVFLLQKSLFWLGYLPQESYITGYFGTETKKALQEFQEAFGVHTTGFWGSLSKQALWHNISGEILHRVGEEKATHKSGQPISPQNQAFTNTEAAVKIWQTLQQWNRGNIAEAISSAIPGGDWKLISGKVGILLMVCGALLGIMKLKSSLNKNSHGQSVKRRVLRSKWYGDSASQTRAGRVFQKGRSDLSRHQLVSKDSDSEVSHMGYLGIPASKAQRETTNKLEHLHINDRQTLRGDSTNGSNPDPEFQFGQEDSMGQYRSSKKAAPLNSREKPRSDSYIGLDRNDKWHVPQGQLKASQGPISMSSKGEMHEALPWTKNASSKLQVGKHEPSTRGVTVEKSPFRRVITNDVPSKRENSRASSKENEWESKVQLSQKGSEMNNTLQKWHAEDELELNRRVEELRTTVQAAEKNRQLAMRALFEERQRSLELEIKISRQREAAAALEEEVRVLKESHDALLASLRKKYSSSAAARAAAALLYQNWDSNGDSSIIGETLF